MPITATPQPGTPITYTSGGLGTTEDANATRFHTHIVRRGDTGTYVGPHPTLDGWHITTVEHDGETLYVPVAPVHFEVAR
jgi:hypothetical protein